MGEGTQRAITEELVTALRERLALPRLDGALALLALTHKSYGNEHRVAAHNERLEFLGDAVVDLVVSHRLMERFPDAREGQLSRWRALIVSEEALARVARRLRLGELLLLGRGEERTGGRDKPSVLADGLEAVLGAVYLSLGLGPAMEVVDTWFAEAFLAVDQRPDGEDFKSRLQEHVQIRHQKPPRYQVVSEVGPDHEKRFEVEVTVGDRAYARGSGRTKKEAEQAAAQKTLALLLPLGEKGPGQPEEP